MRLMLFSMIGGFLLGVAASGMVLPRVAAPQDERSDLGDSGIGPLQAASRDGALIAALEARVAELEAALDEARRGDGETQIAEAMESETPDSKTDLTQDELDSQVETLADLLERGDTAGLVQAILALLRAGASGHEALCEFLEDELNSPRQRLLGNKALSAALISMAFEHGPEVADFADSLCQSYGGVEGVVWPKVDELLVNLLPAFLLHHRGRFPQLQDAFMSRLASDLRSLALPWWRALAAFDELGVRAPLEDLAALLQSSENADQSYYRALLRHLQKLGGLEGLDLLAGFVEGAADPSHWAVKLALHTIGRMDLVEAQDYLAARRRVGSQELRDASDFALASSSLDGLIEYLSSAAPAARKAAALRQVAAAEPELLEELKRDLDLFGDPELRKMIERGGEEPQPQVDQFVLAELGRLFVNNGADRTARQWILPREQAYQQAFNAQAAASFSPDGKLVQFNSGSNDDAAAGIVQYWDAATGQVLQEAEGVVNVVVDPSASVEFHQAQVLGETPVETPSPEPELTFEEAVRRFEEARAALERFGWKVEGIRRTGHPGF